MTTAPHWFGSFDCVMFAGQVIAAHVETVTVKLQLPVRSVASIAVQVTVVVPTGKDDPD